MVNIMLYSIMYTVLYLLWFIARCKCSNPSDIYKPLAIRYGKIDDKLNT